MIYVYAGIAIVLSTAANLLLKIGAGRESVYLNKYTLLGYSLFVLTTFFSYLVLSIIDLKSFVIVMSINYGLVIVSSAIFFKEKFTKIGWLGLVLVLVGINIFIR